MELANLQKARANLVLAEKNAERFTSLAEKNLVSRVEAEQYDSAYKVADTLIYAPRTGSSSLVSPCTT